jgi:uncharacterized protein
MKYLLTFLIIIFHITGIYKSANAEQYIRMVSGPSGGSWYPLGAKIMQTMQFEINGVSTSNTSGGGISNVMSVNSGDAEIGFTYAHTVANGYNGKGKFKKPHKNVRYFATLYPAAFQVAVRADSNIQSFEDMKSANISPGKPKWTGTAFNETILKDYGYGFDTIKSNGGVVHMVSYKESVALMKYGQTDVFMAATSVPQASFIELENSPGIRFIGLPKDRIDRIVKNNPGYVYGKIPASAYKSLDKDITTLGIVTSAIVHKDLPNDLVYKMTKVFWDNHPKFVKVKSVWKKVLLKQAVNGAAIPIHPGAAKYYKEQGLILHANNNIINKEISFNFPNTTVNYRKNKLNIANQSSGEQKNISESVVSKLDELKNRADNEKQKRKELERQLALLKKNNSYNETPTIKTVLENKFNTQSINLSFKKIKKNKNDIAVIIGNGNYEKMGKDIPNVYPAYADADGIKKYFLQAKGIREGNIIFLKDATGSQLLSVFGNQNNHKGRLFNWVKPKKSNVYIYYAGHGVPGGNKGNAYLVPIDADSQSISLSGYPLELLYSNLGKIPANSITVILEACFSGVSQSGNLFVNASPIVITAKKTMIPKNVKVISAGAFDQMASWEMDKTHGLFTKYFLKAMSGEGDKNQDGNVDDKELKEYLNETMTYFARRYYGRDQNVQIIGNR